jgi:hypothetical protein
VTPMAYLTRSSCPFGSKCIEGSCSVVCPMVDHDPNPVISKSYPVSCSADSDCDCSDCDCSDYVASGGYSCRCLDNACYAIIAD